MEQPDTNKLAKTVLLAWAIFFFLCALVGVWAGTGEDALAGPSTLTDNIFAGLWFGFSALQLGLVILLNKRHSHNRWLFWAVIVFAILSFGMVVGPFLIV